MYDVRFNQRTIPATTDPSDKTIDHIATDSMLMQRNKLSPPEHSGGIKLIFSYIFCADKCIKSWAFYFQYFLYFINICGA